MTGSAGKTLLVLGASGKVGQMLRAIWTATPPQGWHIRYQYRSGTPDDETCHCFRPGGDPAKLGPADAVLSLWGVTTGDAEALQQNTTLALEAQRVAKAIGADRVLHCSSVAVYAPSETALHEDDPLAATNPYGRAKAQMETAVQTVPGARPCCLRIGSVAGAESLAASVARYLEEDRPTPLIMHRFASGESPLRSYISPSDLAQCVIDLCCLPLASLPATLNVGATAPLRMSALLQAANIPFTWVDAPALAREFAHMDTQKLQSLTNLSAQTGDAERLVADWMRWRFPA